MPRATGTWCTCVTDSIKASWVDDWGMKPNWQLVGSCAVFSPGF